MNIIVGCIVKKDDKFLMVKEGTGTSQGKWNFPVGHLEEDETILEGAKRETLEETGIRISELEHITVEAVKKGEAVFDSKGTVERKAFINKKLQKELLKYCKEEGIKTGIIFKSRNGNPLDSAYIYKEIQWIAGQARIKKSKAHPHSFRHLFAKNYLSKPGHNIADLKNILGHKNISTTEIYLQKSTRELKETLED